MPATFFLVFLFFTVPWLAFAGHEAGTRITILPEADEVTPGTRVSVSVGVRNGAGRVLPRAAEVATRVIRTAQPLDGPAVHLQPKFQDLAPARLTVLSKTPEELRAAVDVPHVPNVFVTIEATLDGGTAHEVRATANVVGTLPVARPSARSLPTPAPIGHGLRERILNLPPPIVPKRVGSAISVASTFVAVTTAALGFLSLIPDLGFMLRHAALLLGAFSTRRPNTGWGTVVESGIGRPVARAVVSLLDVSVQKIRVSVLTGFNGVFAFAPPPRGMYQIQARAPGYRFPAVRRPPLPADPHAVVYYGEPFPVTEETFGSPAQFFVPMDRSTNISRVARAGARLIRILQRLALRCAPLLFLAGFLWNTMVLLWYPSRLPWVLEGVYVLLFFFHLRVTFRRRRSYGRTLESETHAAIPLAIVRAYENSSNRLTQTAVSDSSGRFFLFLLAGVYTVIAERDGFSPAEDTIVIDRKAGTGVLGGDILLPRLL